MKNLFIVVFLGFILNMGAQNLVINPSFEATQCPIFSPDPEEYITPWSAVPTTRPPQYFNDLCGNSGSANTTNNSQAFDGEGFMGMIVYGQVGPYYTRRYIQGRLSEPLEKGKYYRITFYVKPVDINKSTYGINNIGMALTDSILDTSNVGVDSLIMAEPQIKAENAIINTSYWTPVCGVYKAEGGEEFFTIGNFDTDQNTNATPLDGAVNPLAAYYLVDFVEVVENDYPELPKDTIICLQGRIDIDIDRIDFKYRWNDGSTGGKYIITEPGEYTVEIISPSCSYVDVIVVESVECSDCKIYVPNAFTPNGDGKNEIFQLRSTCEDDLVAYRLQIFDRWGQKVFESTDIKVSWNGLDVDHIGTFTYNLSYSYDQLRKTKTENRRGYLTLIK